MSKIGIIVGSTRQGRQSERLASWVSQEVAKVAEAEIIDLIEYPMPFFDEAIPPRYNPDRTPVAAVKKWLDKVAEFDGFVIVTPEYNRATTAVLKNAIDQLDYQFENKPVAIVGHGSSGAAQAVATLRMTLPGVGAVTIPQALFFAHHVGEAVNEAGELSEELQDNPNGPQVHLAGQIKSLLWYAQALTAARVEAQ